MAERQGAVCSGFLSLAQAAEPRLRPATRLACPCSSIANALAVGNKGDFPCQTHARVQTSAPPPALAHPPPAIATHQPLAPTRAEERRSRKHRVRPCKYQGTRSQ